MGAKEKAIVFYDGHCILCNRVVQLVARHDKDKQFLFAYLQSPAGEQVRNRLKDAAGLAPDSVIVWYGGKAYVKAAAVLKIAMVLGGRWKLLGAGYILPPFMRNWLYDVVAGNRYKWFGSSETCMLPSQEFQSRMINDNIPETL